MTYFVVEDDDDDIPPLTSENQKKAKEEKELGSDIHLTFETLLKIIPFAETKIPTGTPSGMPSNMPSSMPSDSPSMTPTSGGVIPVRHYKVLFISLGLGLFLFGY